MRNQFKTVLLLSSTFLSQIAVAAGDVETNCRDEVVGKRNIYQGSTNCEAIHNYTTYENRKLVRKVYKENLTGNSSETTSPTMTLSKRVQITFTSFGGQEVTYNTDISCTASIPFSHEEDVTQRVCDYTPKAIITSHLIQTRVEKGITYYAAGQAAVKFNFSDRDGSISSAQAWVDGTNVSTNYHIINGAGYYTVRLKVTDNDGYVTEETRTVSVSPFEECSQNGVMILCPNVGT